VPKKPVIPSSGPGARKPAPVYQLPAEMILALQSERPELLQPMINQLKGDKGFMMYNNQIVAEMVRLIGDLMRDIDFHKRKFAHLENEIAEYVLPSATEVKNLAGGLESLAGLLESNEERWKALLGL
jgi:hypothetical protein